MIETDLSKLTFSLALTFVFPVVMYLTGIAWNKMVGASSKVNKIWASVCLLLPIAFLVMLVHYGFDSIRRLWMVSPAVLVCLILVFGALAPAALITVVVRLWRTGPTGRASDLQK
jgi:hypothetical protein